MRIPVITMAFEGTTLEEVNHYKQLIHTLFVQGVLSMRNGQAILHFDTNGLAEIELHRKTWKKNQPVLSSVIPLPPAIEISERA